MRAAAYARYSTDNQTSNSIAYQIEKIQSYCRDNSIILSLFFIDEARSGTNTDREGFNNLLSAAKRKEFEAVIIYDISRGSRDVGDWFSFRKEMLQLNIKVISVTQELGDITKSSDFLFELISVGMGHSEVLQTRQKSIDGVAVKAKQGQFLGGVAPLGYDIVKGTYVINDFEAHLVRTIFEMYSNGDSYNNIIDKLNGAKGKRGQPLGKNSLFSILKNERYIGVYTWNKRHIKMMRKWAGGGANPNCVRIVDAITPIIDIDTWERVQKRMTKNANGTNKAKRQYLLTGLIECESCGARYVGHTSTNKKGHEHTSYTCGNKYRTKTCTSKNITANEIETFVVQNLKDYLFNINAEEVSNEICGSINNNSPDSSKEQSELNNITAKINNGVKAILSGADFPELEEELARLRIRKSELEDIIFVHSRSKKTVNKQDIINMFKSSVENWSTETIPTIIKQYITKIYAHSNGTFTVELGVHINGCGDRI